MSSQIFSSLDADKLINAISEKTAEIVLSRITESQDSVKQEVPISKQELMNVLEISNTTIWRDEKAGKYRSYGIGGRRYYYLSEVLASLRGKHQLLPGEEAGQNG